MSVPIVDGNYRNWEDGGKNEAVAGWIGVGWAYDVTRGGDCVYALAVEKNPAVTPTDEGMPDDYQYDEGRLVFIVPEDDDADTAQAFSFNERLLREFCRDHGYPARIVRDTTVVQRI